MRRALAATALAVGMLAAFDAGAKDMNGRLGVGGARTLAGVGGLDLVYWAGKLALNGTFQIEYSSPEIGDSDLVLRLAAGALFPIVSGERAELSFGGRVNLSAGSGTQISLEAPLRLEWYVNDWFALHGEVGVVIDIVPEDGRVFGSGPSNKGFGFTIGATQLTGGGGFLVIF